MDHEPILSPSRVRTSLGGGVTEPRGLMLGGLFPLPDLSSHPWGPGGESPCSANVCSQTSYTLFIYKAISDTGPFGGQTPSLPFRAADSGPADRCCGTGLGLQTMEALMPSLELQKDFLPNSYSYPTSQ